MRNRLFEGKGNYRIVTDGIAGNTKIYGPDGQIMPNVRRVRMDISGEDQGASVILELEVYVDQLVYEGPLETVEVQWPPKHEES